MGIPRKKYVALYISGRDIPCGALRAIWADEVIRDLKSAGLGKEFSTQPVTKAEYKQINEDICNGHDGLENLIRRYRK